jgi:hypothetical protein
MGIYNKAFSFFNKTIGEASGFAKNHMFPAMKMDYMALKAGSLSMNRHFANLGALGGTMDIRTGLSRGFNAMIGSYRGAGGDPIWGLGRMTGIGVGAGMGMWGLKRTLSRNPNQNNNQPY